jgi:hypothetical protein
LCRSARATDTLVGATDRIRKEMGAFGFPVTPAAVDDPTRARSP